MADTKISALISATTPLAGTEVLPIVQSSTTKQVSVANLTAGRAISATELTLSTGNLVIGTSGKGTDFSANTAAAGMTSQLLNWYEEGTWTPAYSATGLSGVTYLIQQGTYTRIGRAVYVVFYIATSGTFTSGSSTVTITGLPFTSASTNTSHVGFANATRWATAPVSGRISSSTTSINIYSAFNGTGPGTDPVALTGSGMTSGDGGNNNIIQASALYFV